MVNNKIKLPIKKKHFPELREWLNAIIGISALLLAIVSFWTTARISGLEDYLRSEITRRNNDLDSLSKKSSNLEDIADLRQNQIDNLDLTANKLIATSISTQNQLSKALSDLSGVEDEVLTSKLELLNTRDSVKNLSNELKSKNLSLEVLQLRLSYDIIALSFNDLTNSDLSAPSGANYYKLIKKISEEDDRNWVRANIKLVKGNFINVCPKFENITYILPDNLNIGNPLDNLFSSINNSDEKFENKKIEIEKSLANIRERTLQIRTAQRDLINKASICICNTLATDQISTEQICPVI